MLSLTDDYRLQNEVLRRQIDAQQALLRLAIDSRQYKDTLHLLIEAGRLAVELTGAAAGFLYLRSQADPTSKRLGESVRYRLAYQFEGRLAVQPPSQPQSADLAMIEMIGQQKSHRLLPEHTHLLVSLSRRNKVMAVLDLCSAPATQFDQTDVQVVEDLILLLDSILQNHYLLAARTALAELAQDLSAELDLAMLLDKVAKAAATIATAQASSILLLQPDKGGLRFAAAHGVSQVERETLRQLIVPIKGSVAGSVVSSRQPLVDNDVLHNSQFYAGVSDSLSLKTRSLMAVPMIAQDKVVGALEVVNQRFDDEFDTDDVEILSLFASQAAIAIQNARLLAERQASLTELRKLEQRKSQFIALASHELRTPLNLVSGYTTLLRDSLEQAGFPIDHEATNSLEQIEQATTRLISMVNNITSMYNLETGRTQLLLEHRDVVEIIEMVIAEHKEWCQTKGIEVHVEPVQRPLHATCDVIETHRILSNLVGNAVKFTPEGGRISIDAALLDGRHSPSLSRERREVLIAVSDTGPGIDPIQVETIFERFAQIDNHLNRLQGGMGLGLPLAKALVERHGGQLWVETERGQGSTFFFTLPAPR